MNEVITSADESKTYLPFWPSMAQSWKKWGYNTVVGFITKRDKDDPLILEMLRYGEVKVFPHIKELNIQNQAKITRLYLATQYSTSIIADIDCYLLNHEVFKQWQSEWDQDKLLAIGHNAYLNSPESGKFPMIYTTGSREIFHKIINPKNLDYEDLLKSWIGLRVIDRKEDPSKPFNKFSDESLLRALIHQNGENLVKYIQRDDFVGMTAKRRVDRANWNINNEKLQEGYYIDCCPHRPIRPKKLKPILKYLGIKHCELDNYKK